MAAPSPAIKRLRRRFVQLTKTMPPLRCIMVFDASLSLIFAEGESPPLAALCERSDEMGAIFFALRSGHIRGVSPPHGSQLKDGGA